MKKFLAGLLVALIGLSFLPMSVGACGWWFYQPNFPKKK
jgi:cyclic lactone autoinducer peptide